MQTKTPKLLNDRRDSAAFILAVVSNKSFEDYHSDRVLRQAIERSFEIIGESMKRLAEHDPETVARISDYREIIAFRNVLIHGYDLVDHQLVWSTIEHEVPALIRDIDGLTLPRV